MPTSHLLAVNLLDPHSLLASFGALGVFVVLFAETGLLIGIFLPGDSLLFTAGLLCSTSTHDTLHLSLPAVLAAAATGAVFGAQLGYLIGRTAGPALLASPRRVKLRLATERAREHLDRYGPTKAIVFARFIPFVRTVINPLVGVTGVDARTFGLAQLAGGLVWSIGITVAGFGLGSRIPGIDTYLLPVVAAVVLISLIPIVLEIRRARADRARPQ